MLLYWNYGDTARTQVRVWRESWRGDMFEVISKDEFEVLKYFCSLFNIHLIRKED
jgi:hypothetical protein